MLSPLLDPIVIPQLRFTNVNTDECKENLRDGENKKNIAIAKISIKEVDTVSEE